MVSESRLATCNQSFTTSDVQQVLRDFAASSHIADKWILQVLRISNAEHLDSTLGINAPLGRDLWTDHPPTKTHPWQVLFAKKKNLKNGADASTNRILGFFCCTAAPGLGLLLWLF